MPQERSDDMLHIYFGDMPEAIFNTEIYFKNVYDEEWLMDDFAKAVVKGVDKSEVLDKFLIHSPVLGKIPPLMLSGGTKTLLLIKNCPEQVFNASNCGDNCAKYILQIARERDVTINLLHLMRFKEPFWIHVINDNSFVETMAQLLMVAAKYV